MSADLLEDNRRFSASTSELFLVLPQYFLYQKRSDN